jgi:hypothetical protein
MSRGSTGIIGTLKKSKQSNLTMKCDSVQWWSILHVRTTYIRNMETLGYMAKIHQALQSLFSLLEESSFIAGESQPWTIILRVTKWSDFGIVSFVL